MFYAIIASILLLVASRPLWQALVATIIVGLISWLVIYLFVNRSHIKTAELTISRPSLAYLLGATLLQAVIQVAIYGVELHSVNSHISISQMITYSGAANFSLFVALTPGAIGVREAFLLFTRHLHHISSANIVAANVIDRAVFIVVLGILFCLTLGFHAKYKSLWRRSADNDQPDDVISGSVS